MDCTFCKIVAGELPAEVVFEDDNTLAIVPSNAVSEGHTLLLPKHHFDDIFSIDQEQFVALTSVLKNLSARLVKEYKATGLNILNANGEDAQQSVMHLHFHLIPRFPNDNLDLWIKQTL